MHKPKAADSREAKKPVRVRIEHSAGALVFRRVGNRILIGFIMDSYGKWTFPKGHLEKGETASRAALRETGEEMGLHRLWTVGELGSINISFTDRYNHVGDHIKKRIDFFLVETPSEETGRPQKAEGIKAIRWVPVAKAVAFAGYKNVRPIVKRAVILIGSLSTLSRPERQR
jgi:8-oxo-dGTP pyrophosphatase MutT (NUDIX family)